jgi:hypothetical protein
VCAGKSFGVRLVGCFFVSILTFLRLKLADFSEIFVKNKRFAQTEVLDRIAADSDSEVEIESEDDGWPSSDNESSDVVSRSRTLTSYDPE